MDWLIFDMSKILATAGGLIVLIIITAVLSNVVKTIDKIGNRWKKRKLKKGISRKQLKRLKVLNALKNTAEYKLTQKEQKELKRLRRLAGEKYDYLM